jgi:hypothetical protein
MSEEIALAERLTRIEEGQKHLDQKMDLHHTNLVLQLAPLMKLEDKVAENTQDINRWKGVNACLVFIGTLTAAFFGKIHWPHS